MAESTSAEQPPPGGTSEEIIDEAEPDEDDDDEEEEAEQEEEDTEDEEPKLKYQRLGNSVPEILKRESASAVYVHERFIALGTQEGWIYILDFNGNEIRRFGAHTAVVNALSVDKAGEMIASCSDDGTVVLNGLYSAECESFTYQRPVKALALDGKLAGARKGNRQFASGGLAGQLLLNEKGWFSSKDRVLHAGEGPVYAIAWSESLIAWANDAGVKIYDNATSQRITYIDRPKGSPRAQAAPCHLVWETPSSLLIGWGDFVKIALVKERPARDGAAGAKYVEIVSFFHVDFIVAGIAPLGDLLILLAYVVDDDDAAAAAAAPAERPELRILTRSNDEVSSDALSMHGFERLKPSDYHLAARKSSPAAGAPGIGAVGAGAVAGEGEITVYIVSPRDLVVAKSRDFDDHIAWLLDRRRYAQAVREAEEREGDLKRFKMADLGERYLGQLTESREFETAAALCPRLLKDSGPLWAKWIDVFSKIRQQRSIVPYVPVRDPQLKPQVYTGLLLHFLADAPDLLLRLVREWPPAVYSVPAVSEAVRRRLDSLGGVASPGGAGGSTEGAGVKAGEAQVLHEVLAQLLLAMGEYEQAVQLYFKLGHTGVFDLVTQYRLFGAVRDKVAALTRLDPDRAVRLLVAACPDHIPAAPVVAQLGGDRALLHRYLDALFDKDPRLGADWHESQVALYAEFDLPRLLPFLRLSNHYRLETALRLCEDKGLVAETVFVLARMGNAGRALRLLLRDAQDVSEAVAFCREQGDEALWDELIRHCVAVQPRLLGPLLGAIGAHVDPLRAVRRIPPGLRVDGLRDRLIRILADAHLQRSLREGCVRIVRADVGGLQQRHLKALRRPLRLDAAATCALTRAPLVGPAPPAAAAGPSAEGDGVVLFHGRAYKASALAAVCLEVSQAGGGGGSAAAAAAGGADGAGAGKKKAAGGAAGGPGAAAAAAAQSAGGMSDAPHMHARLLMSKGWSLEVSPSGEPVLRPPTAA